MESIYLTSLRHIGQRTRRFLLLSIAIHIKFVQTRGTKSMATMYEYSGYVVASIIIVLAQLAGVLIDEFSNEFLYFRVELIGDGLSLPEEESSGVL